MDESWNKREKEKGRKESIKEIRKENKTKENQTKYGSEKQ